MIYLITASDDHWMVTEQNQSEDAVLVEFKSSITVRRGFPHPLSKRTLLETLRKRITENEDNWVVPGYSAWTFDLEAMRTQFDALATVPWLRGRVTLEPEFETSKVGEEFEAHFADSLKRQGRSIEQVRPFDQYTATLRFIVAPEQLETHQQSMHTPVEILQSLQRFQDDFPDPASAAFLIMRFGETSVHADILEGLKRALGRHSITGLRADDKLYHDDLLQNIVTYMHGCSFGVAVFERIEEESFNPNIALEIGYLMALGKPVCIVKDRTLKTLHSDLMGRIYRTFDPTNALDTVDEAITPWLRDKGFSRAE